MKVFSALFFATAIIFLFYGCSASSPDRYTRNRDKEKKQLEDKDTFTSKDSIDIGEYEFDEEEFEDYSGESPIDVESVLKQFELDISKIDADNGSISEKMLIEIVRYIKTPYKYGGTTDKGIDCSAFTQKVYGNALQIQLLRSAREQYTRGESVSDKDNLKFGDLVFFNTRRRVRPGHVGIYLGEGMFAHASSKLGVTISNLNEGYYLQRYMGARRMLD